MKIRQFKILFVILMLGLPLIALSEEIKKDKILIHNFSYVMPETETSNTAPESIKKFQYYSFIIPQTLSKNISVEDNYNIERRYDTLTIKSIFQDEEERIAHVRELIAIAKENSSDYLVSGDCSISEGMLTINVSLFNARGHDIVTFQHRSSELGAVFKETTDYIASELIKNIEIIAELDRDRFRPSPFLPVYSLIEGLSIGIDAGYLFIHKPWNDFYNNTFLTSPYLMYSFNELLALSIKYDYIQSDSKGKNFPDYYQVDFKGLSLLGHIKYNFFKNASIGLSLGGGLIKTGILKNSSEPLMYPGLKASSNDPYIDGTFYLNYRLSAIEIKTGIIHKRIFYKDEHIKMSGIYAGAGFIF